MKQINFESSNYSSKEELKAFLSSFNETLDKCNKTLSSTRGQLGKINTEINKKENSIQKLETIFIELSKREEELKSLKLLAASDIKSLEAKKKSIDYTDSEVQKMEKEDIDILINSKKNKISKIDAKLELTRSKITENKEDKKNAAANLKDLEGKRKIEEEMQFRTDALIKLIEETKEKFNDDVYNIITKVYIPSKETEDVVEAPIPELHVEEPVKELVSLDVTEPDNDDEVVIKDDENSNVDISFEEDNQDLDIEEPTLDLEPLVNEINEASEEEKSELSMLDFDNLNLPNEILPDDETKTDDGIDYKQLIIETFQKEGIDFDSFDEITKQQLLENKDRVLKNIIVLKKHQIPLVLTIKQPKIYYCISSQDLDDLLNIITVDDDGNGMGFSIDYVFYVLDELSQINVDKLIEVYNSEFMNVNSKSGLIKLLKLANADLGDFETNRNINIEMLKTLGVKNTDQIENEYKEFLDLDNPLFLKVLNLFDKNDLVNKINANAKIIPKIMNYWLNN